MNAKTTRLQALQSQVQRTQGRLEYLNRTSYRYSWVRLTIFVAGLAISGTIFYLAGVWLTAGSLALWTPLFGIIAYYHRQIDASIERHRVWLQIKSAHVARMQLNWEQIPPSFGHQPQADHPFESDLDLVGRCSLHQLVDTAVSYEGSQRLRDWLTAPVPDPEQTWRRQQLVRELTPLSLFRDKLALNAIVAGGAGSTWRSSRLVSWLERHRPAPGLRLWLLLLGGLTGINLLLFISNRLGWLPPVWQITFLVYLGLVLVRSYSVERVLDKAMALQEALRQLGAAFEQLETFPYYNTPHLKTLCRPFLDPARRPSGYLARLARVVAAVGIRGNLITWFVLNALVPWDIYFERQLTQLKADLAQQLPAWMEVWFELEALNALANLAYLNPDYTFPTLLADESAHPVFEAQDLGHPLIPDEERICNDLAVPNLGHVAIITGSNMAGKTVFMKTVGLNLALAYAGGPVNARRLKTWPLRLFTCIQVTDSVTSGISYFYAEVKRLKALLEALELDHPLPLFFYIDEIFRGTNNRERLIGSRAYLDRLVGNHGVGLIATHDLELAKLAEDAPQIINYHFRDHVRDGRMAFDYTLRPGPSPTTNALKIMQLEGLITTPA